MGKEKKNRKHAGSSRAGADPTGQAALAAALAASPSATAAEHAAHQAGLLAKLEPGATAVQKAVACSGIAHILANQLRPAASLVTRPLLTKLLPLLVDSHSYDVAISAAGAVRNISAIGAHASGTQEIAAANQVMSLLLNGDACSIIISTLEAEKTQWMDALTDGAASAAAASSSSASASAAPASLQPVTALDKRCHFLSQMVSALSNMIEHFDVVLGYFLANASALATVLNILDDKLLVSHSEWGVALRVEISNLLMLVSEGNPAFMTALPGAQGQEVVSMLLRRLDPSTTVSPQVRTQCSGVLLNMMDKMIPSFLAPASASLALPPPGQEAQAGPGMGMGAEQTCVTRVLATLSSMLDLDPESLGARLVAELSVARQGLNAQLHAVDAGRKAQDSHHKRMAEARHASKMAAKAAAGGGGGGSMEDEAAMGESSMGDDPALAADGAASAESSAALVAEESSAALADAVSAPDAASSTDADTDLVYADAHDAVESTHKDASGAAAGGASSASKRSPEVLLAAQWSAHLERTLGVLRQSLLAVRMSLELLTNLASTDEDAGTDSSSDSDTDSSASLALNPAQLGYIPKLILQLGLLQKIGQKCSVRIGNAGGSGPGANLLRDLHAIYPAAEDVDVRIVGLVDEVRMRAINAANNLVLFLPVSVLAAATAGPASAAGAPAVAFLPALFTATCTNMHNLSGAYVAPPPLNVSPLGMQATEEMQSLASLLFQVALKAVPTMAAAGSASSSGSVAGAPQTIEVNEAVMQMLLPLARAPPTGFESAAAPAQAASSMSASASSSAAASHQSHQHAIATAFALAPGKRSVQLHVIYLLSLLCEKHPAARAAYHERVATVLLEAISYAANVLQSASRGGAGSAAPAWLGQIATASSAESSFLEVAGEALNGLVDLFSEDLIYAQEQTRIGLIPALQAFLPIYDAAIKLLHKQARQLRVDPGLIERLGGHAVNAKEFVKYKLKHP